MHQNIRRGLLGTLFAGGLLALGCTAANAADNTSGSDGLLSGTQVVAPVTAPITLGATSAGVLGDSTATTTGTTEPAGNPAAGSTTTGSDAALSGAQILAPSSAPVSLGAASVGFSGKSTAAVATRMLANTGADTNLLMVAFLVLGAGLLMMLVARRRKA